MLWKVLEIQTGPVWEKIHFKSLMKRMQLPIYELHRKERQPKASYKGANFWSYIRRLQMHTHIHFTPSTSTTCHANWSFQKYLGAEFCIALQNKSNNSMLLVKSIERRKVHEEALFKLLATTLPQDRIFTHFEERTFLRFFLIRNCKNQNWSARKYEAWEFSVTYSLV